MGLRELVTDVLLDLFDARPDPPTPLDRYRVTQQEREAEALRRRAETVSRQADLLAGRPRRDVG